MMYTVDRIEGGYAVMLGEDGESEDVLTSALDTPPEEGFIYERTENGFAFSAELTEDRRKRLARRTRNLFGGGGHEK